MQKTFRSGRVVYRDFYRLVHSASCGKRTFADHIVQNDPATQRALFDLSYVPAPDETPREATAVVEQMRRIGMKRFLFGSDFNVLTPLQEIKDIKKLSLTQEELRTLQQNCAPWVCS